MIDCAKVADLVLLLIDASFGFEMEQFEFLNVCQVHGFPKIMGVLTHLDHFKNISKLRKRKKILKQRFWTEIYQGAKLFYLSGLLHGRYPNMEIHNLARSVLLLSCAPAEDPSTNWGSERALTCHVRFISVMKYRPLVWRNTHPYLLADRVEDMTPVEAIRDNIKCDRRVALYGFVRGTHLKRGMKVWAPISQTRQGCCVNARARAILTPCRPAMGRMPGPRARRGRLRHGRCRPPGGSVPAAGEGKDQVPERQGTLASRSGASCGF